MEQVDKVSCLKKKISNGWPGWSGWIRSALFSEKISGSWPSPAGRATERYGILTEISRTTTTPALVKQRAPKQNHESARAETQTMPEICRAPVPSRLDEISRVGEPLTSINSCSENLIKFYCYALWDVLWAPLVLCS